MATREQFRSRKGQSRPTIEIRVDREGRRLMVVRVTVLDTESAGALIRLLVREVDAERVRFEPDSQQVCVDIARSPDQAVGRVLSTVEAWLGDGGRAPTDVEIDEHRYVLGARQPAVESL
jgi:hypothetical protein